jgi:predicted ribosomally synthesized peptide with SipW-like signal peptide
MKKSRIMALALVAAITASGVGYAAWTDSLNVNTTINTGELSVHFVGPDHQHGSVYYASPRMFYATSNNPWAQQAWNSAVKDDLLTSKVTWGNKTMTFEFGNMYPGTRANGLYTFENDGSIPAVIQNVSVQSTTTVDNGDGAQVLPAMRVTHAWLKVIRNNGTVAAEDQKYIQDIALADLEKTLEDFFKGKRLQPGDMVVLGDIDDQVKDSFNFELPLGSLNANEGEKETVQINVTFDFVQHNAYDSTK